MRPERKARSFWEQVRRGNPLPGRKAMRLPIAVATRRQADPAFTRKANHLGELSEPVFQGASPSPFHALLDAVAHTGVIHRPLVSVRRGAPPSLLPGSHEGAERRLGAATWGIFARLPRDRQARRRRSTGGVSPLGPLFRETGRTSFHFAPIQVG